jgi:hypothetical protein
MEGRTHSGLAGSDTALSLQSLPPKKKRRVRYVSYVGREGSLLNARVTDLIEVVLKVDDVEKESHGTAEREPDVFGSVEVLFNSSLHAEVACDAEAGGY